MLFGTSVWSRHLADDRDYWKAIARQCGQVTPEAEFNWALVEPARDRFDFSGADAIARFARATSKNIHGHSLLWHLAIPPWAKEAMATREGWWLVRRYMERTMRRYGNKVPSWDVVNEPIEPKDGRADGLRQSPYVSAFGPDYIERALTAAREIAPNAALFVNEYGLEYDTPEEDARRRALLKLLERLKARGVPLAGVGVQAHLDLAKQDHFRADVLTRFFNEIGALGLQIRISELDVKEADPHQSVARRDKAVADATQRYLEAALANRAVGSVSCWGITDRYSWLNQPYSTNCGLPLDNGYRPKPMFAAIRATLRQRARMTRS